MSEERDFVHQNFGGEARPGDIAPYVLLPSDKDRVRKFAAHWDEARQVADHYEWLVYTGTYRGVPVSACSTGIGGTSVSTAIEELARLGGRTFLRAGVTRPLVDELGLGEAVIARGAVRLDGASHDYVRAEYPAVADNDVLMAAAVAAEHLGLPYKIGVIGDMASLGSRSMEGHRRHLTQRTEPIIRELYDAGVIDGTGESAVLMIQCALYGLRCGVINVNGLDQANNRWDPIADERAVALGLETVRIVAEWDSRDGTK
ncbi:MAG: uridine phosphorylase [Hyphomicrobiales bacterium]|nr:uridine phosphorylase [Hyphomicrobiales bacterium]